MPEKYIRNISFFDAEEKQKHIYLVLNVLIDIFACLRLLRQTLLTLNILSSLSVVQNIIISVIINIC